MAFVSRPFPFVLSLFATLALLAAACGAPQTVVDQAATATDDSAPPGPLFDFTETTLENGLRVVVLEDHSAPIAAIQLWYHVGAKDEEPHRRGFAHMFEHMMFQGTPRLEEGEHMRLVETTGGASNAYTAFDQTVYTQTVPSNQLEMVLWLEAERMAFLRIDEPSFETERAVVAEEYRKTAEQPYGKVLDALLPQLFADGAYAWSPIGYMDELAQASHVELQAFWERYYVPNNATLVIAGDVVAADAITLAQRTFGWIPRYADPPHPNAAAPARTEPLAIVLQEKKGPAPIVGVAWRTVPAGHADETALQLLGAILGGGESSRVYRRLVTDERAAMVALGGAFSFELDGVFGAGAVLSPVGADVEAARTALLEEVAKLRSEGVTDAELEKAKNQAMRSLVTSQLSVNSKAQILGTAAVIYGDTAKANDALEELRGVTRDDLLRVAQTYLDAQHRITIEVEPSLVGAIFGGLGGGGAAAAPPSDVTAPAEPDAISEAPSWGKPGIERPADLPLAPPMAPPSVASVATDARWHTLENGLRVAILPNHEVPFVTFHLGLDAGGWADPPELPGAASVAAQMLTRGTANHDYNALTDELDAFAINLGGGADMDNASVHADAVTDQAERALSLLAEVVLTPTFPADQLTLIVDQMRTGLAMQEASPSFQAERMARRQIWGTHPYARQAPPELDELDALDAKALAGWWARHARPDQAVLIIAGDLNEADALKLAETYFAGWQSPAEPAEAPVFGMAEPAATHIVLIDHPGDEAWVQLGHPSITRRDDAYFASKVMSHILGGGSLSSRLNASVRGELGLTYGVHGGINPSRFAGSFGVGFSSGSPTAAQAIGEVLRQIARLQQEPPTEEELMRAKQYVVGAFLLSRETPQSVASYLWLQVSEHLGDDYYPRFIEGVAGTSGDDVQRVARELIDAGRLTIVVVGPADVLRADLEKFGPVEVVAP